MNIEQIKQEERDRIKKMLENAKIKWTPLSSYLLQEPTDPLSYNRALDDGISLID